MKIRILTNSYCLWFVAAMLSLTVTSPAAPVTWSGNGDPNASGNWSATTNWDTGSYPSTADIATLGDVSTGTRTVSYDIVGGTLSGLIFNQTTASGTNELDVLNNLTINSAVNIGATAGATRLRMGTTTTLLTLSTSGLTVSSGGTLDVGLGSSGNSVTTNFKGAVTVAGGSILINQAGGSTTAYASFANELSMSSGTIVLDNGNSKDTRLSVGTTLSITGGSIGKTANNIFGSIYLGGVSNTMTGFTWSGYGADLVLNGNNQSLLIDKHIYALTLRNVSGNAIKTITSSEAAHSFNTIGIGQLTNGAKSTLLMGSDLVGDKTYSTLKFSGVGGPADGSTVTFAVDLNGHTFDITNNAALWKPDSGSKFTAIWSLTNSSATAGRFAAAGFDFTGTNVSTIVGDNVVMESRGGNGTANNLSDTSTGSGTISAASTFLYNGGAASATAATLISNRTIGALTVDKKPVTGTSSNLMLQSAITTAGNVSIKDAGSQIKLNGQILTLSGSAKLTGIGTYSSDVAGAKIRFATGSTGGLDINETGVVGTINLAGGSMETIDLSNAAVSIFDINGTGLGSFDSMNLNLSTIVYGGILQLNFGYTPVVDEQFQIFSNVGAGSSGNFSSITSNLGAGYNVGFSTTAGIVTVTVVPEPSTYLLLVVGGILMITARKMRRVSRVEV